MLKIHSFLQRIRMPVSRFQIQRIGKYKMHMAVIAYMMITVLFILSPDYIYGTGKKGSSPYAMAESVGQMSENMAEETANEATVRTDQKKPDNIFILYSLTNIGSPLKLVTDTALTADTTEGSIEDTAKVQKAEAVIKETVMKKAGTETVEKVNAEEVNAKKVNTEKITAKKPAAETADSKTVTGSTTTAVKAKAIAKAVLKKKQNTKKYVISLSESEISVLQRIVEAEATGEDIKGKILVANVILNRMRSKIFPDTVKDVVFQKNQFSPIRDGRYWSVKISKSTIKAVERVMQGEDYSRGALYFSARAKADKSSMRWFDNHLDYLFKYGHHEFFK